MGFIWMILAAIGFAISVILMRIMTQTMSMPTYQIGIWRFIIAGSLMWLINPILQGNTELPKRRPFWLIGLGLIFSISGYSALFALEKLPSSIYIIIIYIYPSLVVLYSFLSHRPLPYLYWLGLPLSFLGLVLTAYQPGKPLEINLFGLVMTLLNALSRAAYFLLSEKVFNGVENRLSGTNWVMSGAMLVSLGLIPIFGIEFPSTPREGILLFIYSVFGTMMPILSMNVGLQLLGAARSSVIITIQPVLTIIIAVLLLNENLTFQQWIGGLLVVIAVILLQSSPDRSI